jgi:syntaxin 16
MSRDRTNEYLAIKCRQKNNVNTHTFTIKIDNPQWIIVYNDIISKFGELDNSLDSLNKHILQYSTVSFGKEKNDNEKERENMICEIKNKLSNVTLLLEILQKKYKEDLEKKPDGDTNFDRTFLANMEEFLINEIKSFKAKITDKEKKINKISEKKENTIKKYNYTQDIEDKCKKDYEHYQYVLEGRSLDEIEKLEQEKRDVEDQEKEYTKLNGEVKNLYFMQQELHTIVIKQGTVLDTIDYNMNISLDKIVHAKKELKEAQEIQKKNKYTKICCWAFVLLFILIFVAIKKYT